MRDQGNPNLIRIVVDTNREPPVPANLALAWGEALLTDLNRAVLIVEGLDREAISFRLHMLGTGSTRAEFEVLEANTAAIKRNTTAVYQGTAAAIAAALVTIVVSSRATCAEPTFRLMDDHGGTTVTVVCGDYEESISRSKIPVTGELNARIEPEGAGALLTDSVTTEVLGPVFDTYGQRISGLRGDIFQTQDGERFEIVQNDGPGGMPSAETVKIYARRSDMIPTEGLADAVIKIVDWEKLPRSGSRTGFWSGSGELDDADRILESFGPLGENEFLARGRVRGNGDTAYFDADDGKSYRIENPRAVQKIHSGEVVAVLEQRGEPLEDSSPRVWIVKFQTAEYNLGD